MFKSVCLTWFFNICYVRLWLIGWLEVGNQRDFGTLMFLFSLFCSIQTCSVIIDWLPQPLCFFWSSSVFSISLSLFLLRVCVWKWNCQWLYRCYGNAIKAYTQSCWCVKLTGNESKMNWQIRSATTITPKDLCIMQNGEPKQKM